MKTKIFFSVTALAILLLIVAGCERKIVYENNGGEEFASCFTCHSGDGRLEQAHGEWANSIHASGTSVDYTNRPGSDCTQCHNHQGFIEFLETGAVTAPYDIVSAIHCHTCHAPHETGNLELRTVEAFTLADGSEFDHGKANLCANCHHSRVGVDDIVDGIIIPSRWGPHHGPQGDLLNGSNGYEMTGYTYGNSNHATIVRDGCIGCHMGDTLFHEGYNIGGHSVNMVDEETGDNLSIQCKACHAGTYSNFDFAAPSDYDGDGTVEGYQTEMEGMLEELRALLVTAGLLNGSTGLPIPDTIADGDLAGALYNWEMIEEDRSLGIHNYEYARTLIQNSLDYMEDRMQ